MTAMTKAEARSHLAKIRYGTRQADEALRANDSPSFVGSLRVIISASNELLRTVLGRGSYADGIRGMHPEE